MRVWDVESGECVWILNRHASSSLAVCGLGDERVVTGSGDNTARIWDVETGECLGVFPWHAPITSLATSPERPGFIAAGDQLGNVLFLQFQEPAGKLRRVSKRHG
jgi:WD40 repeat protein